MSRPPRDLTLLPDTEVYSNTGGQASKPWPAAGADVVMTTSALLRHGPAHAAVLLDGLVAWMERKGFGGIGEIRGMLAPPTDVSQPGFGRSGYLSAVEKASRAYAPG